MIEGPVSAAELASAIERMTGVDPSSYLAERIGAQSGAGDEIGVRRLTEIARSIDSRNSDAHG